MKKVISVLILLVLMAGVYVRISTAGWDDIWCVGGATTQICFSEDGHIVPITAGSQNLGTVSYPWGVLNLQTLTVTTGITAPTATFSGALYQGAIATRSTMPAAGSPRFHGTVNVSASIIAGAAVQGVTGVFSSTLDVDGNAYFGADNFKSTFTASSGDLAVHNDITIGGDINVAVGSITVSGGTLDVAGASTLSGQVLMGAIATISTMTTAGVLTTAGDITAGGNITGATVSIPSDVSPQANITASVAGELWYNSSAKGVCHSTAAAAYSMVFSSAPLSVCN